ncbi:LLM class flavin-dependent oxidoreductase [Nocardioides nitrophenolicus]|uniref:LLM class flavin-dependent oxidoreductase n=1 Tax=Nocardioides nitrophenolicus TaxID=60489 RepID=UPI001956FA6A|nr:LLM class flavin-dependent oxidoreductase [Nocardioides nitrophenolicus]MBM7517995.1 alkanesulfonate monooxygenase SsuD/methylene tetrahydromethanopterin reductase-like flavin-dependent oxidoreductase (luciferase family) [Nocardioides nitrophenolicus]
MSTPLDVGMTLPVMEPDLAPAMLRDWAERIDAGPYSSLCFGERIAFDNPDALTLLGAVAAWTGRVRIATTVVVPQLHDPVLLAKALATGDQLSGGRLSVGLGVGGREEDYAAVAADWSSRTMADLAERAGVLRRVWAAENLTGATRPVGPRPVRPGGPELLVGTLGHRIVRHAARWADGLAGMSLTADVDETAALFDVARAAWAENGRPAPRLTTSFWFALAETSPDPRGQIHRHLRHYMNWLPPALVDALAPTAGFAGSLDQLRALLDRFAAIGADEVQLIPTSDDPRQVDLVADLLGG